VEFDESKYQFIQTWGTFGTKWGINRAMAQIHALLMVTPDPLCTEDIMEALNISRGNTSMNVRALIDWGLVSKVFLPGQRKEYFQAEKDIWKAIRQIAQERRKREVEPVLELLEELKGVEGKTQEVQEFRKITADLATFTRDMDKVLQLMTKRDAAWFFNLVRKVL